MNIKLLLLTLLTQSYFTCLYAQHTVSLASLPDTAIQLKPYLALFTDETKAMTWEAANQALDQGAFIPFEQATFKKMFERGKYAYWFYFAINYQDSLPRRVVIRNFGGGQFTVHHLIDTNLIDKFKLGWGIGEILDRKQPDLAYLRKDIPLTLQAGKNEFLIRVVAATTFHPTQVKPILLKEAFLLSQKERWLFPYFGTWGLFFGVLIFVFLFSLIQYSQHREFSFLIFGVYVLSFFLVCARQFGLENGYFLFFPYRFFEQDMHTFVMLPIYFFKVLFVKTFLQTKENHPRIDKLISFVLGLLLLYFIVERVTFYGIDTNLAYRLDKIFRPFLLSISILILVVLLQVKDKLARLIGFGILSLVVFTLIGLLITYGDATQRWMWWDKAYSLSQVGILLELLIFSNALGYRAKQIADAKNQAQLDLLLKRKEAEQLQELDQIKNQFFTNITHEFRTPLTVIQGIAQQIQENPTKELPKRTNLIQSNASNLLQLVNQLLDLSRADFQQYNIQYNQQDIITYLSYLTNAFQSVASNKEVNLSFHTYKDQQWMDFDSAAIKTIGTNLIGNALKFTPEFGAIKVVVEVFPPEKIVSIIKKDTMINQVIVGLENKQEFLQSKDTTSFLKWTVTDTGIGIAETALPYIFDRFYQADTRDTKEIYGTGIGLALVKELVQLLGGFIHVKSTINEGSSFSVFLPIHNEAAMAQKIKPIAQSIPSGEAHSDYIATQLPTEAVATNLDRPVLLIVEDSRDVIYYLQSLLAEKYELLTANNGKKGLALALEHVPDIILSDVMMPQMNGYELCKKLKKDIRTSHIPVILLTAKATQESKYQGLEMGATAYLHKPFDKRELLLQLENVIFLKKQIQLSISLKQDIPSLNPSLDAITTQEFNFIQQLRAAVLENLSNELFRAPHLAKAMAMSQTQLYRKLKALTNQSIAQYIKIIRLEQGKKMLETTDFSIGQIAVEVGFKTQAHFTRSFQEAFGQNPSSVRK